MPTVGTRYWGRHPWARPVLRRSRRGLLASVLVILVLAVGHGDYRPSSLDLAVAPHEYSLARWELSHFLDKWLHKLGELPPWTSEPPRQARIAQAQEFFALGGELTELEHRVQDAGAGVAGSTQDGQVLSWLAEMEAIKERRRRIQAAVEETIESEISSVLSQEGFASRIGLIFPPVDTVFSRSPAVLVLSPRDRIERLRTILLAPGLDDEVREQVEERIFREEDLSALVESSGGVATYPSVVSESGSLHYALVTAAHEWLHHWFYFQPLGQRFWASSEMTTLNETAATLGGEAIGDRAFTAMTGEPMVREPYPPPLPDPGAFDFDRAMRETRLRTEELLAAGRVQDAEAYMEERRRVMVANGYYIRKINQAFFAFHGTYATSPASISPIDRQLRELQSRSESLGDFIKTVARFGSYQEFLEYLDGGAGGAR